jgi:peptidoglycan/LPS O-acetylase OafA/YrhL
LVAFSAMSVYTTGGGPIGVIVFVLGLAIIGVSWWLPLWAIQRAPKSRLARAALYAVCGATFAYAFGDEQWLWPLRWLVLPLQAAAVIIAIVVLRRNQEGTIAMPPTTLPDSPA